MPWPTLQYQTEDAFRRAYPTLPIAPEESARLLGRLQLASTLVSEHCHRLFVPYTDTFVFDAPVDEVLALPDCQAITSVSAFGATLSSSEYKLLPYTLTPLAPTYTGLQRRRAGMPGGWTLGAPSTRYGAVVILGLWGYSLTPPVPVVEATGAVAWRLWMAEDERWSGGGGNATVGQTTTPAGLLDGVIADLLARYVLPDEEAPCRG